MTHRSIGVGLLLVVLAAAGCRSREPLQVSTIQTGRSLNSDNSVGAHATRFKPDDTLYAAVITDRAGAGTLTARWTYGGRVINETTRDVAYADRAATEFHIDFAGPFPEGEYTVEILVDGQPAGTRQLRVAR